MQFKEKLQRVKKLIPNAPGNEQIEYVYFLDWMTKESEFLNSIYPTFKKDINPESSFIEMCLALWHDESTKIKYENFTSLS